MGLVELVIQSSRPAVVSHGRRHGDGIRLPLQSMQALLQIGASVHWVALQAIQPGGIHRQGTVDQLHFSPPQPGRLSQQHAHAASAGIADATGWIQPLAGGTRRDQ